MNPAPPVTRTRFLRKLELLVDGVEGPALDVSLDSAQIFPDQREDESVDSEDEQDGDAAEQRPGEVRVADPEDHAVGAEREGAEGAERADPDADQLDRLRPEAGEDVQ